MFMTYYPCTLHSVIENKAPNNDYFLGNCFALISRQALTSTSGRSLSLDVGCGSWTRVSPRSRGGALLLVDGHDHGLLRRGRPHQPLGHRGLRSAQTTAARASPTWNTPSTR